MTWTPETNRIPWGLLTEEEQARIAAAKYGWWVVSEFSGELADRKDPGWYYYFVYRAKPAPAIAEQIPPELWKLLQKDYVGVAYDRWGWCAYLEKPLQGSLVWNGVAFVALSCLDLPVPDDWRTSWVPRPEGL